MRQLAEQLVFERRHKEQLPFDLSYQRLQIPQLVLTVERFQRSYGGGVNVYPLLPPFVTVRLILLLVQVRDIRHCKLEQHISDSPLWIGLAVDALQRQRKCLPKELLGRKVEQLACVQELTKEDSPPW